MSTEILLYVEHHTDLLILGIKVLKGITFPNRNNLHNSEVKHGCVIVNVTRFLNRDISLCIGWCQKLVKSK